METIDMTGFSGGRAEFFSAKGNSLNYQEYNAFTLAEVLITLGIIGVVAAMTLPTLINKTQDKILESQYAKSKTIVVNGYKLMMAKSNNFKVENLPFLNNCNSLNETACVSKEHKNAFNIASDSATGIDADVMPDEYIIQGKTDKSPFNWDDVPYIFATADGMTYGVLPDEDLTSFSVVADVNGTKNPNTVKKDLYKFRFSGDGRIADVSSELEEVASTCSKDNPEGCKTSEECLSIESWEVRISEYSSFTYYTYWNGSSCRINSR